MTTGDPPLEPTVAKQYQIQDNDARKLLNSFWICVTAGGMLATVATALWIGFQDVVWPVSLSAQVLGLFFVIAGLLGLASAGLLVAKMLPSVPFVNMLPFVRWRETSSGQLAFISGGAVAGSYVDITIVAYSFRYQVGKVSLFGLLALDCVYLAWRTLPETWKDISKSVKGAGITLAALGTVANFWFQSFYLPENAQVGVEYGLSTGPVVTSGSNRLVTLDLTMDDESPVTALTLGSMVVVRGIEYTNSRNSDISNAEAQKQIRAYAASLVGKPSGESSAVPNPNIRLGGQLESTVLTILRPVANDSYLFPNDANSRDFDVVIPNRGIVALDVTLYVQFARTTRLVLGPRIISAMKYYKWCPNDEQSAWYIEQSALIRFTRGAQVLYSDWCADLGNPFIHWAVAGTRGTHDSAGAESDIASHIDVINSSRDDVIVLP